MVTNRSLERAMLGALAGVVATMAMTAAMRRFHGTLPVDERYPLPPREIIDSLETEEDEQRLRDRTLLAHFGYGGLTGALFALLPAFRGGGILYGLAVWAASYLGWIPAAGILKPVYRHPLHRNLVMIAAHVVWGLTLSSSVKELEGARRDDAFGGKDTQPHRLSRDLPHD